MKRLCLSGVGVAALVIVTLATAGSARADVVAAYAQGHGGFDSGGTSAAANNGSTMGLGYGLGARLLIFEGYFDYTTFGQGSTVSRGILGLRGGFGSKTTRLVLRAGAGIINEQGGALTGRLPGTPDRSGAVGRLGAAIESRIAPLLFVGLALDGERFALSEPNSSLTGAGVIVGSSIFARLHILFEIGV
jgi:hypothetical protein